MNVESTVLIDAPRDAVWGIFTDVERWPEWTASVRCITPLDGAALAIGRRFEIRQPGLPKLVWTVTAVDPGVSWVWEVRSPGATSKAEHSLTQEDGGRTLVRQAITQTGPLGAIVGRMVRRRTHRFLEMEGQGLRARCESATGRPADGPAPDRGQTA